MFSERNVWLTDAENVGLSVIATWKEFTSQIMSVLGPCHMPKLSLRRRHKPTLPGQACVVLWEAGQGRGVAGVPRRLELMAELARRTRDCHVEDV